MHLRAEVARLPCWRHNPLVFAHSPALSSFLECLIVPEFACLKQYLKSVALSVFVVTECREYQAMNNRAICERRFANTLTLLGRQVCGHQERLIYCLLSRVVYPLPISGSPGRSTNHLTNEGRLGRC
jgi:hypothetical protein